MSKIAIRSLLLLVLAYLGLACAGYLDNLRGPFFPEILTDLNLRDDVGSLFFSCASLLAFLASPIFDFLKKYFSVLQVWAIGVVAMAAGFYLMSQAGGVYGLFLYAALFGFGFGTVSIGQNLLVFENVAQDLRRQIFSGLHSMYGLASLAAPVLAAHFMREKMEWREAFQISALAPVVLFLLAFALVFKKQSRDQQVTAEVNPHVFQHHRLLAWIWALVNAFYLFAEVSISSRLVLYLHRHREMSLVDATQYLTGFFAALWIGRVLFTICHFRKVTTAQILVVAMVSSIICLSAGFLFHPVWLAIAGFTLAPIFPFMMEALVQQFGKHCQKPMSFVVGFGSLAIVLMHVLVGVISSQWSLQTALWIGPLGLGLSLALMFLSYRQQAQSRR